MRLVLLDTDVFSFLYKRDSRGVLYATELTGAQPCLSYQSVAELHLWSLIRRWGVRRRQSLDNSLKRCLVLPYDDLMAQQWAELTADRRQQGRPIGCGDAWIAATALRHDLSLLTHNASDYAGIAGLKVICHASPPSP